MVWLAVGLVRGARTRAAVREAGAVEVGERHGARRRLLRDGDSPSDAHGPGTAGTDGDVDAEDASEVRHPGESMGSVGGSCGASKMVMEGRARGG